MNQEYIHINKACKRYNKSRQTFYNYMNKGWIRNKKVHNKVFLHDEDIKRVLSDTIQVEAQAPTGSEVIENNDTLTNDINDTNDKEITQISVLHEAKKWMNDMHTSLSTHIDLSVKDIQNNTDLKITQIQDKVNQENRILKDNIKYLQEELDKQKKSSGLHEFVYGFILLAAIISILIYIFN